MKRGCLVLVSIIGIGIIGLFLADWLLPSAATRNLPHSATEKQEYFAGFNDYVRLIKAKLPPEDFDLYAQNLGMSNKYNKNDPDKMYANLGHGDAPIWWDPPKASENTYFEYRTGYVRCLKYDAGVVYYMECTW